MDGAKKKPAGKAGGFLLAVALLGVFGLGAILREAQCSTAWVGDRFIIPYRAADDLTTVDQRFEQDGVHLKVSIVPRPVAPMRDFELSLLVQDLQNRNVEQARVELAWNMDMDMGRIEYRLLPVEGTPGLYAADVVLPVCVWGGTRWYGRLRIHRDDGPVEKVFILDME